MIQEFMKKFFMFLAVIGIFSVSAQYAVAQTAETETALHQALKAKFIEGTPEYMGVILLFLIIGLSVAIERIIYLTLSTTDTKKLLANVEKALNENGVEAAKEVCRNTRGPIASIFYQGLLHSDKGVEEVEKTITAYGSVQMSLLERGLSWIQLFIIIAPMFGFLGTVVGMIFTFDDIQAAGDISPNVVAGGMKFILITTVAGLVVAMVLQVFYNYIVAKIDSIVVNMEDSAISLIDILVKAKK